MAPVDLTALKVATDDHLQQNTSLQKAQSVSPMTPSPHASMETLHEEKPATAATESDSSTSSGDQGGGLSGEVDIESLATQEEITSPSSSDTGGATSLPTRNAPPSDSPPSLAENISQDSAAVLNDHEEVEQNNELTVKFEATDAEPGKSAAELPNVAGRQEHNGIGPHQVFREHHPTTAAPAPPVVDPTLKRAPVEVIDLLDSDDEETATKPDNVQEQERKRQRLTENPSSRGAVASYNSRVSHMPDWMKYAPSSQRVGTSIIPGASLAARETLPLPKPSALPTPIALPTHTPGVAVAAPPPPTYEFDTPIYLHWPRGFTPTWEKLTPDPPKQKQRKAFRLSLLNVSEFTFEGLPVTMDGPPTSISGLRSTIKSVSRDHGKAVYEKSSNGVGGKWRIPLGAYHAFFSYLKSDPMTTVEGIPQQQLQIASLERARQERGYPTAEKLMQLGLPAGLANALAPFQRGGVDFCVSKGGRVLIADGACAIFDFTRELMSVFAERVLTETIVPCLVVSLVCHYP